MNLRRLSIDDKEAIKVLFTGVFTREPWNDDWSDNKQIFLLTDRDVPAYNFYKKNSYVEVSNLVPFAKHI